MHARWLLLILATAGCTALRGRHDLGDGVVFREGLGATLGFASADGSPAQEPGDTSPLCGEIYLEGYVVPFGLRGGFPWAQARDGSRYSGYAIQAMYLAELTPTFLAYGGLGPVFGTLRGTAQTGERGESVTGVRGLAGVSAEIGRFEYLTWSPYLEVAYMTSFTVNGESFDALGVVFGLAMEFAFDRRGWTP